MISGKIHYFCDHNHRSIYTTCNFIIGQKTEFSNDKINSKQIKLSTMQFDYLQSTFESCKLIDRRKNEIQSNTQRDSIKKFNAFENEFRTS